MNWLRRFIGAALLLIAAAGAALAGPLEDAKAGGLVGEKADGYLGIVSQAPPQIQRMVDEINLKRKERYREIAKQNGTSLNAVEQIAGKKLVERAVGGEFVQDSTGRWIRK